MGAMMDLPQKSKSAKRTKQLKRKKRRAKKSKEAYTTVHYRSLLAILMFLYMLRLIDDKTFNKVKKALSPPRAVKRRRAKSKRSSRRR